jgi:hypothetical protein
MSYMTPNDLSWTETAFELQGPAFNRFQTELAKYNTRQLQPALPADSWREELDDYAKVMRAEGDYIEAVRHEVGPLVANVPSGVDQEALSRWGDTHVAADRFFELCKVVERDPHLDAQGSAQCWSGCIEQRTR